MIRPLALSLLLVPVCAYAQLDAPAEPVLEPPPAPSTNAPPPALMPSPPPSRRSRYQSLVRDHKPSPEWTQDRSFTSTRFWLLDPGQWEVETWLRTRIYPEVGGVTAPAELLMQVEAEIGVLPHLQIDVYENVTFNQEDDGVRRMQQEGNQIEARIAIPSYYGQIPTNPVLYFEWHPRHNAPDRFEFRLLLGGSPTKWLYLAANPYVETNVESTDVATATLGPMNQPMLAHQSKFIADMEFGTTLAAGFRITDWFRLSAEMKIGADMLGSDDNQLHFVWWMGPGFIVKPLPEKYRKYLKIMGTLLVALPPTPSEAQLLEPMLIIGSQF
jgi:hypothetical protein